MKRRSGQGLGYGLTSVVWGRGRTVVRRRGAENPSCPDRSASGEVLSTSSDDDGWPWWPVVAARRSAWPPSPAPADAISDKRAQAAQIAQKLDQLGTQIDQLGQQYDAAQEQLGTVNAQIDDGGQAGGGRPTTSWAWPASSWPATRCRPTCRAARAPCPTSCSPATATTPCASSSTSRRRRATATT